MMAGGQPGQPQQGGQGDQGGTQGDPNQQQTQAPVDQYIQSMNGQTNISLDDLESNAEMLANQLLGGIPEGVKDSQLRRLKQFNPTLHSLTRTKMDEKRNAVRQ